MQDLSHLLARGPISALSPTSQSGGNQRFSNDTAQTAPGSEPAAPANSVPGEITEHPAPEISAETCQSPVVLAPDGSAVNADHADRSRPFAGDSGGGWAGKPVLVRGGWNDLGGGPGPDGA